MWGHFPGNPVYGLNVDQKHPAFTYFPTEPKLSVVADDKRTRNPLTAARSRLYMLDSIAYANQNAFEANVCGGTLMASGMD